LSWFRRKKQKQIEKKKEPPRPGFGGVPWGIKGTRNCPLKKKTGTKKKQVNRQKKITTKGGLGGGKSYERKTRGSGKTEKKKYLGTGESKMVGKTGVHVGGSNGGRGTLIKPNRAPSKKGTDLEEKQK